MFIPYSEIDRLGRRTVDIGNLMVLHLKHYVKYQNPLTNKIEFLGKGGVEELERMVGTPSPSKQ